MTSLQKPGFYTTPPHKCSYLPAREAVTLFADPYFPKSARLYSALADCGFRRSGTLLYVPNCSGCTACVPVRVPVDEFCPSRNQRRTWRKNRDIVVHARAAAFRQEHFDLYTKYLAARHRNGGMDKPTPQQYMEFLTAPWVETIFYEMQVNGQLVAVAIADLMDNAMSAVYTFFDPEAAWRSPGRFAILYEISEARSMKLQWLYLGYWIENCRKMNYKSEYHPQQHFVNNDWHTKKRNVSE